MTTLAGKADASRIMVGYCWPWTVRPGQQVDFMVSCRGDGAYRADLVRITCADNLSSAQMFKEEQIDAPFSGQYPGRVQATSTGSYVEIAPSAVLDSLTSFTVQAMVCPTLLPEGVRVRQGGVLNSWEDPVFGEQHLISRWDNRAREGWALLLDETGRAVFMAGRGAHVHRAVLDTALIQDKWFLVAGSLDAENGVLYVAAQAVDHAAADRVSWPAMRQHERYSRVEPAPQVGPLRFAACADGPGARTRLKPACCFNGRLDRVRLTAGMLALEDTFALAQTTIPSSLKSRVIGFWDFSSDIERIEITDLSANALHGVTINVPMRAVRGVGWDGSVDDWRARPDHYSAIHFHDDDLDDAEWQSDFSYTVPTDLPSGIYAARLRKGESEDYIPFFVAPPKGQARAAVALLLPTLSYTAYTNVTGLSTFKIKRRITDATGQPHLIEQDLHPCLLQNAEDEAFLLKHLRELGKGIYSNHTDGTLATSASQRHPNMTIKPKGITWTLVADTHLTDWLEQKRIPYDVITDDLLHAEGVELLTRYGVVLTGNHPEYCSKRMLDAIDQYQRGGGRWMYLGGNGFYCVTSVHSQLPGVIEVRKDHMFAGHCSHTEARHAFDGIRGGLWQDNARAPQLLMGVGFRASYWEDGVPYKRLPDSYQSRAAFIFEGVSSETFGDYGLLSRAAAGQEVDAIDVECGTPAHALHLARATFVQDSFVAENYIRKRPLIADVVFFETPNGGAVFSVGSMTWVGSLSHNRYQNDVSRITENVLRRFVGKKPFRFETRE